MIRSVDFWYFLISLRATTPGRFLFFFRTGFLSEALFNFFMTIYFWGEALISVGLVDIPEMLEAVDMSSMLFICFMGEGLGLISLIWF